MLRAGIDAGRSSKGVFAVAGVAFGYDNALKANRKWERLMDGRVFHMTDLNARKRDFSGISDDEVSVVMKGMVEIIRSYASYIVTVSCADDLITEPMPKEANRGRVSEEMLNLLRSPYGFMCHMCMYGLGRFASQRRSAKDSISFILESGDEGQKGLIRFMRYIEGTQEADVLRDRYSYGRLFTVQKHEMEGIFHAADFIAWEWGRHVERHSEGKAMRRSLSTLVGNNRTIKGDLGLTLEGENRFFFRHYDERNMDRYVAAMRRVIEARSTVDVDHALAQWDASRLKSSD
ncbi:hypothetical protein [Oricola sp.]|uniref:hypothetical protein n=1 Tax=Oricola sp. TaxID=1979950 RepID=UPI0025FFB2DE|nr:hypothetical protein [Oricola sp.]MCI5073516.1 hypothetical protein [Oricola sp.]